MQIHQECCETAPNEFERTAEEILGHCLVFCQCLLCEAHVSNTSDRQGLKHLLLFLFTLNVFCTVCIFIFEQILIKQTIPASISPSVLFWWRITLLNWCAGISSAVICYKCSQFPECLGTQNNQYIIVTAGFTSCPCP